MTNPREINWFDFSRLKSGTARQRSAAESLLNAGLPRKLNSFSPVLCGTIPIDCDLPESDLDIICCVPELNDFLADAEIAFGKLPGFAIKEKDLFGEDSVICRFELGDWPVEIVAQKRDVICQRAYAHMLAEALLLYEAPPGSNNIIRGLKRRGLSTEEAFASHFGLPGDPYEALFRLYEVRFGVDCS